MREQSILKTERTARTKRIGRTESTEITARTVRTERRVSVFMKNSSLSESLWIL